MYMSDSAEYPSASATSYAAIILLAGYLNYRVMTPPVPVDTNASKDDSLYTRSGGFRGLHIYAGFLATLFFYHSANAFLFRTPAAALICPNPQRPNSALLSWSPQSSILLALIIIAGSLRLGAYRALGSSFTFTLTPPKNGLITTGIYAYVQHPSYTALIATVIAVMSFLWRVDGPAACWVEPGMVLGLFNALLISMSAFGTISMFSARVKDEEAFLKKEFGKEWEEWNRKTARFVPFVW